MSKGKLQKFSEMESFSNVFQYTFQNMKEAGLAFGKKGKWADYFGNSNPIVVELGCGKGEYTVALAQLFPDRNFIGIDIKGARMWSGAKDSLQKGLKNAAFVRTSIEMLPAFFAPGEISEIWLTFPDPQMKKVHKRLTSTTFMALYQQVLPQGGIIHLKTDSNFMFTYTCEMVKANGFEVLFQTNDLYHSGFADDKILSIRTFYESQWIERGISIKYITFRLNPKNEYIEPDVEIPFDDYRSFNRGPRGQQPARHKDEDK
jgi:tRNA (guanine-N7-)-methyltransferase